MSKVEKISTEFDYSEKIKGNFGKFWFERYPESHSLYSRFNFDKYKQIKKILTKKERMLDVGVGMGDTFFLFQSFFDYFYGIDPSNEMVEIANYNIKKRNLKNSIVNKGIAEKLEYEDSFFDAVFMLDVFEHIHDNDLDASLKEIRRVLKPNGVLYIATPSRKQIHFWSYFDNLLTKLLIDKKCKLKQLPQKKHYEKFYTHKEIKTILRKNRLIIKNKFSSSFYPAPERPGTFQKIVTKIKNKKLIYKIIKRCFYFFEMLPFCRQKMIFIITKKKD